ncbi:hypothetical protein [Fimbriiglobus ruber]|uniref:Uncharacterized protein n=1 Tax=Fimbriiglobus ruber TaxID=1908690 RepID=A0A225DL85_9BACT|nr:hypothetical protein [Fimbriiglobus ruber]OWK39765.1 hypothetical protein FRUB_05655 [Fimbriiglobus ruber]OWK42250.1 hypothetical protein FRUB_04328 [Fimbriiglobus ruber]OWK42273.1 hypothetical protein FRUB_04351 [Fimbriiglobus ruber]
MGVDRTRYRPALQAKIVFAGANNTSYAQAERDLRALADIDLSDKQVRRTCKAIGHERVAERDAAVAHDLQQPLTDRKSVPEGVTAPSLGVVGVDGGRLQIFERGRTGEAEPPEDIHDDTLFPDPDPSPTTHWCEDKIGALLTMTSEEKGRDPCPEIPAHFVDRSWIPQLAKELKARRSAGSTATEPRPDPTPDAPAPSAAPAPTVTWVPEVVTRTLVATRQRWAAFGPMMAAAAWRAGFFGAPRRVFLGDGAETNWTVWRNDFSSFTPVLDFIHVVSYVFAAAMAGRASGDGWVIYERWIRWVWAGDVAQVITALTARQAELGVPGAEDAATSPRKVVAAALGSFRNNKDRMRYADYRRLGLPIVSSYVESAVKQFNYRVKGTEKFWREVGAEEMLQLRADYLSDDEPMEEFWVRRQASESGQARHALAV